LQRRLNVETSGLTAEEIEKALNDAPSLSPVAHEIRTILNDCDRVRYGRDSLRLAVERAPEVSEGLERIARAA
jgi:hypothetical protein